MHPTYRLLIPILAVLIVNGSCISVAQKSSSYPNPPLARTESASTIHPSPTLARATATNTVPPIPSLMQGDVLNILHSPTPYLYTVAPELLFSPTPDPNAFSITAKIEKEYSQEKIARILFSTWLYHYLGSDVSLEMRLSDYKINKITIPADQHCASKLGALFMAEAEVTATTAMPAQAPIGQYSSRWMQSAGGYVFESKTQRTILFRSAILKRQNKYVLKVIMQNPTCD